MENHFIAEMNGTATLRGRKMNIQFICMRKSGFITAKLRPTEVRLQTAVDVALTFHK